MNKKIEKSAIWDFRKRTVTFPIPKEQIPIIQKMLKKNPKATWTYRLDNLMKPQQKTIEEVILEKHYVEEAIKNNWVHSADKEMIKDTIKETKQKIASLLKEFEKRGEKIDRHPVMFILEKPSGKITHLKSIIFTEIQCEQLLKEIKELK